MTLTKLIHFACLLAVANARSVTDFDFGFSNVGLPADFNFGFSTLSNRIIGGHDVNEGDFPHQISMQYKFPENGILYFTHFCGGSILNNKWILTAAHCVVPMETADPRVVFAVKAGKHDLSNTEDTEQISQVDKYFVHEKYNRKAELKVSPYDIALIRLKKPLRLNKRVVAIELPEKNSEPSGKVILSGWGAIDGDNEHPEMPYILQTTDMVIIDRATCNRTIYELSGGRLPYDLIDQTNICSGPLVTGLSACGGDSGGPLISKDSNGKTKIVGIVSWGFVPCGSRKAPSIYARTSFFIDWIENTITKNQN